jgi:hypothetical protein
MQWRQPPERTNRLRSERIEFGRGRARAAGYLAHSDRVGPSVLLLGLSSERTADALSEAGFTVLAPDPGPSPSSVEAAAGFLTENWHPRLGVIAHPPHGPDEAWALMQARAELDVVVVHDSFFPTPPPGVALVGHFSEDAYSIEAQRFFEGAVAAGNEVEVYVYEGERRGFVDPASESYSSAAAELAANRTLDALGYHLS